MERFNESHSAVLVLFKLVQFGKSMYVFPRIEVVSEVVDVYFSSVRIIFGGPFSCSVSRFTPVISNIISNLMFFSVVE